MLKEISEIAKIPCIPVTINIYLAGHILGNARCFISGRYHPSILASLGGTPCVFMGSNSHKTSSLQTVLEIPQNKQVTFSAIPDKEEVPEIVDAFHEAVAYGNRECIKEVCKKNATLAEGIKNAFEEC
jgi:polysaccharide pyruvyl transferase WcaK-like protein